MKPQPSTHTARAGVDDIRLYLRSLPNVLKIHDLHVWAISTTEVAMTVQLGGERLLVPQTAKCAPFRAVWAATLSPGGFHRAI